MSTGLSAMMACLPPRSPDLLNAHEGAVRDVTRFLLFTRDAHDDHVAVASRFRADADVGRSPVLVPDREQDLGVSRLERAGTAHGPGCAVRNRGARFGPAGPFRTVPMLVVQFGSRTSISRTSPDSVSLGYTPCGSQGTVLHAV